MNSVARHRRILVIDDEKLIRWTLRERLERAGYTVVEAEHGAAAFEAMRQEDFDLLLLDFKLPDTDGLEILKVAKERKPAPAVILMTAFASVQNAVEAMRLGAYDYVKKPFNLEELLLDVEKAVETVTLRAEVSRYQSLDRARFSVANLVGSSPKTQEIRKLVQRVGKSGARTILISGETGTGKGLVARAIHLESDAPTPPSSTSCTALPETLLEHSSATSAARSPTRARKKGCSNSPVGDGVPGRDRRPAAAAAGQAAALPRDKTFRRLGGTRDISVDVRIVAATNKG
jgi:DNA-binding NtrC family response regulator